MKKLLPFLIIAIMVGCTNPTPKLNLAALISDHMVLQQNKAVQLWGSTEPGVTVDAIASWGGAGKAEAGNDGKWIITLNTPPAGGPYTITFSARKTKIVVEDVLIGEVWLCSGQSNMEMPLKGWPPGDTINNSASEIATANYPDIRMFTVARALSFTPVENCTGSWDVCSPETAGGFSATAYFFGRYLYNQLNVPVGLIHSSWGGTPAESWTSPDYLTKVEGFDSVKVTLQKARKNLAILNKWLATLDSVNLNSLPADKPYSALKLDDTKYSMAEFNDSSWNTMALPGFWENAGLTAFDGIVWFRKEFNMPKSLDPDGLILHLGPIDDMDAAYVNGIKIGGIEEGGFWTKDRIYTIPQSALKEGKNVVAVRVIDTRGGGGIYGKNISIDRGDKEIISLNGEWKYLPTAVIFSNMLYKFNETDKGFANMPHLACPLDANTPGILYNAMINPLLNYTIKGAIWYQGESNVGRGKQYSSLFPAMIQNWRDVWKEGDFPFYFVQIAPYDYGENSGDAVAELRDAQLQTMKKTANVGMVVTMDIGNPATIHPGNKQEVGRRLALWALAKDYGMQDTVYSGPVFKSVLFDGNEAFIDFDYVDGGLTCTRDKLNGFEIAGNDGVYYPADAIIAGDTVVVQSKKVKIPEAVRFGWDDDIRTNLANKAGLPASPFITKE